MSHELFHPDDIFINRVKTHPEYDFFIYDTKVILNNHQNISGSYSDNILGIPNGHVSLFELNVNRDASSQSNLVLPLLENGGNAYNHTFRSTINSMLGKRTVLSHSTCNTGSLTVAPAASETGSFPMSAGISRQLTQAQTNYSVADVYNCGPATTQPLTVTINLSASALQNVARKYTTLSKHFIFVPTGDNAKLYTYGGGMHGNTYDGGAGNHGSAATNQYLTRDLTKSTINMINVPSIFYGSSVKKGSVTLKYYITGTLIAECKDENENGELIGTYGNTSGSVVGICMYDEGILLLTSSVALDSGNNIVYEDGSAAQDASWLQYGTTCQDGYASTSTNISASYNLNLKGTSYTSTMTLFCHSRKGFHNHSNNPTAIDILAASGSTYTPQTSSYTYSEHSIGVKNIVSSSYKDAEEEFRKTTYITKVGIYDDKDNLIAIANLANPVKKTEEDDYTFKLTLDI